MRNAEDDSIFNFVMFGGQFLPLFFLFLCTECKERNYLSKKNKRNNPDRLEVKKYCPRERRVTLHRETK